MTPARPVRLRLSRAKGFNLQAASLALNGLPAVVVSRPSRWGNPLKVGARVECPDYGIVIPEITPKLAVELFREVWARRLEDGPAAQAVLKGVRGKNLACWCALDAPCHADVLLELANGPHCEAVEAPITYTVTPPIDANTSPEARDAIAELARAAGELLRRQQ